MSKFLNDNADADDADEDRASKTAGLKMDA